MSETLQNKLSAFREKREHLIDLTMARQFLEQIPSIDFIDFDSEITISKSQSEGLTLLSALPSKSSKDEISAWLVQTVIATGILKRCYFYTLEFDSAPWALISLSTEPTWIVDIWNNTSAPQHRINLLSEDQTVWLRLMQFENLIDAYVVNL